MDRKGILIAIGVGALLVLLTTLPPFVGEGVRGVLMQAFNSVCHQLPGRTAHIDGIPLAVCHRCYAIYWGFPIAALLLVVLRSPAVTRASRGRDRWLLAASLIPMAVDWSGEVLGLWSNTPLSRTITGLIFGLVAGWFFARALAAPKSSS